jgi:signal peptidase I
VRTLTSEGTVVSLCILLLLFVASICVSAWLLALTARSVGSAKARLRTGFRAVLIIAAMSIIVTLFSSRIPIRDMRSALIVGVVSLGVQLYLSFLCLRQTFGLSPMRTLAPWGAYVGLAIFQVALALLLIRPFIVQAFSVESGAMAPTFNAGDRFVANKLVRPVRLDVVAYRREDDPLAPIYIKRLIGLPGERLRFENGGIFVNDQPIALPPFLAGKVHAMPRTSAPVRYQDGETIQLGNDDYFFIGDDPAISLDSRLLGPSHASDIVGVADLAYWPPRRARVLR